MAYDFDGRKYRQASSHQKEWGFKLIQDLHLSGSEQVLDLGCGDGALSAQLAELVPKGSVLGLDASPGMIAAAGGFQGSNLSFVLKDINDLDFDNQFDIVFSNATLHWIKDHDRMLERVHRSLKPGGALRFNFAGDGNCSHFYKVIRQAMAHPLFTRYFSAFDWPWYMPTVEEYEVLVRRLPFVSVRVWGEKADRYFPDEEAMVKWLDQPSLVPFLKHVPQPDRGEFRSWVIEEMIKLTRQPDGTCFETFRRVNVSARKDPA